MNTWYQCDYCHTSYSKKKFAIRCEKGHPQIKINKIIFTNIFIMKDRFLVKIEGKIDFIYNKIEYKDFYIMMYEDSNMRLKFMIDYYEENEEFDHIMSNNIMELNKYLEFKFYKTKKCKDFLKKLLEEVEKKLPESIKLTKDNIFTNKEN